MISFVNTLRMAKTFALFGSTSVQKTILKDTFIEQYSGKKRGCKATSKSAQENRDAAFDAFAKKYDPGTRDDWAATGLCLQAAFGKENEWDRLSSASQYRPLTFWRFSEAKDYSGKIPFTATEKRKLPTKQATECELNHR